MSFCRVLLFVFQHPQGVERIRNLFPEESLRIVAAGGDAEFFLKYISGLEAAGNNCTLYGINKAWEYYINES